LEGERTSAVAFAKAQSLLAKVLLVSDDNMMEQGGVVALVGPTGVGKTTTIAKLAAKFILKHSPRQVALITTDNFRIGAHEQLTIYARILNVPIKSAANAQELRTLINGFHDKKLILIDTAGMASNDMRLAQQLMMLQDHNIPVKSYLVMSATMQYKAMQAIIAAFQMVEPTACIITKMDEADSKGAVISTLIERQLPVAFITNGQQVPEDIYIPHAKRLVEQCAAELDVNYDGKVVAGYEDWVTTGYA
jgi:flagellar biosynthesis protein FlhF